ncbi:MAG: hypothetical protein UZ11_BCD004000675 [Bacteroidetes bacterium OLB11]|nr:MAG: hypothetical protein UZ11_BCD004000675 [Bacteroidetes bacterium OLB11]
MATKKATQSKTTSKKMLKLFQVKRQLKSQPLNQ